MSKACAYLVKKEYIPSTECNVNSNLNTAQQVQLYHLLNYGVSYYYRIAYQNKIRPKHVTVTSNMK